MTGLAVALVHNHLTWGENDTGRVETLKKGTVHISAAVLVPFAALFDAFTNYVAYAAVYAVIATRKIVQLVNAKIDFLKQASAEKAQEIFNHANVSFFLLFPSGPQGFYDPEIQNQYIDIYYVRAALATQVPLKTNSVPASESSPIGRGSILTPTNEKKETKSPV